MKAIPAFVVLSAILFSGCGGQQQAAPPPSTPEVSTIVVSTQSVALTTDLPGRTSAFLISEIRPQVSGLLLKRLFEEGDDIVAGQELYQIDPAPFQAAVDNSEANLATMKKNADRAKAGLDASIAEIARQKAVLELAEINSERYQELFRKDAITAVQRDQVVTEVKVAAATLRAASAQVESDHQAVAAAIAAVKQAEAALETAKIQLGYTKITSPISGRIGRSNVTEGAIVMAYQTLALATIQQLDPIYVDVTQSTIDLNKLKRKLANGNLKSDGSDSVKIILDDGTEYTHEGSLKFKDVTVDQSTGSVILRIVVPNPEGVLLPGMFVRAIAREGINENAILVPQQGVQRDHKGNPLAYVIGAEGKVEIKQLVLDRAIGDKWMVASGLNPHDHLIVEGIQKVKPGMVVKESPFDPTSKEGESSQPDAQPVADSK